MRKIIYIMSAALFAAFISTGVRSQDYPARRVTVIVPTAPGATTDLIARLIARNLSDALGQPFIVENRAGAAGTLGSAIVARAKPDGYTLLVTVNNPLVHNVYLQKDFPFDPRTAFAPVSLTGHVLLMLAVHPSLPITTMNDFINFAKQNPTALSYGTAGTGSSHHIAGELLKKLGNIDMRHVPYRGGSPAIADLVAGHISAAFGTPATLLPHATAGTLRILALTEAKRTSDYPDLPTIAETVPGVVVTTWSGLFAPAGTPRPIIERLNRIVVETLKKPEIVALLRQQGIVAMSSTPEELSEKLTTDLDNWGKLFKVLGFAPE